MDLLTWVRQEHDGLRSRLHDWFVAGVPADRWIVRPNDLGCSFAWLILHTTMHQDVAINVVVRGEAPVWAAHWGALGVGPLAPWDALNEHDALDPTSAPDVAALVAYADATADATTRWLATATDASFDQVPPSAERLVAAGVTGADVAWVAERWAAKPTSWFVQWEAIGHTLLHQGEMASLRGRLGVQR